MRLRHLAYFVALTLVLAALIHIVAVLALPRLAPKTAWRRLQPLAPVNTMIALPPATPKEQILALMAPDIRYAVCRFDLSKGPVRVRTVAESNLWLIALYTPAGDNFYTVTGADIKNRRIELIIADPNTTVAEEGMDAPEGADQIAIVRSPSKSGVILIRAPLTGPSLAARADAALKASTCRPY